MTSTAGTYLILTRHLIVAEDLAQILAQHDPTGAVLRARDPEAAAALLDGAARVSLAFLADAHGQEGWDEALAMVEARGARVVLIPRDDDPAPKDTARFTVLERPFTTEMVLAVLASLAPRHGKAAGRESGQEAGQG
ncbi:hypothetical protein [Frigidibacter sp. MR17.24]|uniref:hypothetical protein n=1 Tax=Frigidibacter sp. MR17.24 TaxID=3127345 RepID=UPI0030131D7A